MKKREAVLGWSARSRSCRPRRMGTLAIPERAQPAAQQRVEISWLALQNDQPTKIPCIRQGKGERLGAILPIV